MDMSHHIINCIKIQYLLDCYHTHSNLWHSSLHPLMIAHPRPKKIPKLITCFHISWTQNITHNSQILSMSWLVMSNLTPIVDGWLVLIIIIHFFSCQWLFSPCCRYVLTRMWCSALSCKQSWKRTSHLPGDWWKWLHVRLHHTWCISCQSYHHRRTSCHIRHQDQHGSKSHFFNKYCQLLHDSVIQT